MSLGDRTEAQMTALVEQIAERVIGADTWAETSLFQRYKFKEMILPLMDAVIDVLDEQPHQAKRGDEVEAWIKSTRDEYHDKGGFSWMALDHLLDDYRLHADTATPLTNDVDEMGG